MLIPRTTPLLSVENPEPELAWVELDRTMCTGRTGWYRPECDEYTVRVYADGRVQWDGLTNVTTLGEAEGRIEPHEAQRLIDATERRLPKLGPLECAVDHTHKVGILVARPGAAQVLRYWGCGRPYLAAGRPIDQAAGTDRWR